jgi:predicted flavoprotein YhiN
VSFILLELGHSGFLADMSNLKLKEIANFINGWSVIPSGTEGFAKAEVTSGGIDTDEISSKTFEAKSVPGLFFIGEVLDVTGWLGGYNFQWAWASGKAAGDYV